MKSKLPMLVAVAAAVCLLYSMLPPPNADLATVEPEAGYFVATPTLDGRLPDAVAPPSGADHLVLDEDLVYLFDYQLAGLGENNPDAARAALERELDRRLRPLAAIEARHVLDDYIAYKRALADLARTQPGLTEAERRDRLSALAARLPPALNAPRDTAFRAGRLQEAVRQLRTLGANDEQIYQLRAEILSREAADRLAEADRAEAEFQRRLATYLDERRKMMATAASAEAQQALRDAYFSPEEQKRLTGYE
jgi:lipase chaperone LimK